MKVVRILLLTALLAIGVFPVDAGGGKKGNKAITPKKGKATTKTAYKKKTRSDFEKCRDNFSGAINAYLNKPETKSLIKFFKGEIGLTKTTCDTDKTNALVKGLHDIRRDMVVLKEVLLAYVAEFKESTAPGTAPEMKKNDGWNCGDELDLPDYSKFSGMGGDGRPGHGNPIGIHALGLQATFPNLTREQLTSICCTVPDPLRNLKHKWIVCGRSGSMGDNGFHFKQAYVDADKKSINCHAKYI